MTTTKIRGKATPGMDCDINKCKMPNICRAHLDSKFDPIIKEQIRTGPLITTRKSLSVLEQKHRPLWRTDMGTYTSNLEAEGPGA